MIAMFVIVAGIKVFPNAMVIYCPVLSAFLPGFMVPTWLLSMWISNTATAAMMISILNSVISQLAEQSRRTNRSVGSELEGIQFSTLLSFQPFYSLSARMLVSTVHVVHNSDSVQRDYLKVLR